MTANAVATATQSFRRMTAKCAELGWVCIPVATEAYGAWGAEALGFFSKLASLLALKTGTQGIYGQLNLHLEGSNANAILKRCLQEWVGKLK